jgi:hypothetical protein
MLPERIWSDVFLSAPLSRQPDGMKTSRGPVLIASRETSAESSAGDESLQSFTKCGNNGVADEFF